MHASKIIFVNIVPMKNLYSSTAVVDFCYKYQVIYFFILKSSYLQC